MMDHGIIGDVVVNAIIALLTFFLTWQYIRRREKSNAKMSEEQANFAEISTIEKKIDAYNKIITDLDTKLVDSISNCKLLEQRYSELENKYLKLSMEYEALKRKHDIIVNRMDHEKN